MRMLSTCGLGSHARMVQCIQLGTLVHRLNRVILGRPSILQGGLMPRPGRLVTRRVRNSLVTHLI